MSFEPVQRTRLAEQVAGTIRDAIFGGRFNPGDALPAERDLATQFGVNRSSVREALHRLEAVGLVEVRHGGGTRVTEFLTTAGLQMLPWLLAPGGQLDPRMLRDLLEIRVALLGFTAELAAQRATPEALADARSALARMEAAGADHELAQHDFDLFEGLVRAGGNRVLGLVANAARRVYTEHGELFAALYARGVDLEALGGVLDAVEARDPVAARRAYEACARAWL